MVTVTVMVTVMVTVTVIVTVIVMTAKRPRNLGGTGRHPLAPALVCRHEVDTGAWRHRCGQPAVDGV